MKYLKTYNKINESNNENDWIKNISTISDIINYIDKNFKIFEQQLYDAIIELVDDGDVFDHMDEYEDHFDLDNNYDEDDPDTYPEMATDESKIAYYMDYNNNWEAEEIVLDNIIDDLFYEPIIPDLVVSTALDDDNYISNLIRGYIGKMDYTDFNYSEEYTFNDDGIYMWTKTKEFKEYKEANKMGLL